MTSLIRIFLACIKKALVFSYVVCIYTEGSKGQTRQFEFLRGMAGRGGMGFSVAALFSTVRKTRIICFTAIIFYEQNHCLVLKNTIVKR